MCFIAFRVDDSTVQILLSSLQQLYITDDSPCSRRPRVKTARQDMNVYFTAFRVDDSTVQILLSSLQQLYITDDSPCSRHPRVKTARQNSNMCFYCIPCLS